MHLFFFIIRKSSYHIDIFIKASNIKKTYLWY